jgi:hypothetical protein
MSQNESNNVMSSQDQSQGHHVPHLNIHASRMDSNIDMSQSMSNGTTGRQLGQESPRGYQNVQQLRPEMHPNGTAELISVNGSQYGGLGYDNMANGVFQPGVNLSKEDRSNAQDWHYNPRGYSKMLTMTPTFVDPQRATPAMQPYAYEYLPRGYDQSYNQQHDHHVTPTLLPQANTQASGTPMHFATQTQATLAADRAHQPSQQSASHQLSPPVYHGQTSTQSTYTANGTPVPLSFTSRTQARTYQYKRKFDWQCPKNDVTIPQNDAQREDYVHQLKAAMIDISQTGDNSRTFSKRWKNPLASGEPFYEPEHIEIVCRDLIDVAEMLHSGGPATLPIFDKEALKTAARSKDLTFAERFKLMVDLVLDSKTLCDALMRSEKLAVFVACADQKTKNLGHNRKANGDKKELLKLGYEQRGKAKKGNTTEVEEKDDKEDEGKDGGEKQEPAAAPVAAESLHDTLEAAQIASRQRITQASNDGLAHTHPKMQQEVPEHDARPPISSPAEKHTCFLPVTQTYAWPNTPSHPSVQFVLCQDDFRPSNHLVNGTEFDPLMLEIGAFQNGSERQGSSLGQHAEAANISPSAIQSRKRSVDAARLDDEDGRSVKRANEAIARL